MIFPTKERKELRLRGGYFELENSMDIKKNDKEPLKAKEAGG
jgi:hypothetical protein